MNREVGIFQGFPTYQEAMAFVNRFTHSGKPVHNLDRFSGLMEALGNPQDKLNVVHIAGTNGKGSVGRYLGSVFQAAGLKTGEYTSPYIQDYRDRIRVNSQWIPEETLMRLAWQVKEALMGLAQSGVQMAEFSQFEITTAVGFLYFLETECEIVCLEVGMGGLLDATNVVKNPLISVITHISLDHTSVLGSTIEEIATQKAGIIKRGCPVIISPRMDSRAEKVLKMAANAINAPLSKPDWRKVQNPKCNGLFEDFDFIGEDPSVNSTHIRLRMPGEHQAENAMLALGALNLLKTLKPLNSAVLRLQSIGQEVVKSGISAAAVPLRGELIHVPGGPEILLDGAHNPGGMAALRELLSENVYLHGKHVLVIGMLSNKLWKQSVEVLLSSEKLKFSTVYAVDGFYQGCVSAIELANFCRQYVSEVRTVSLSSLQTSIDFLQEIFNSKEQIEMAVFAGSLYLGSMLRKALGHFCKEGTVI